MPKPAPDYLRTLASIQHFANGCSHHANPIRWQSLAPDERSAASGVTGVARTVGASLSPIFTGLFLLESSLVESAIFHFRWG